MGHTPGERTGRPFARAVAISDLCLWGGQETALEDLSVQQWHWEPALPPTGLRARWSRVRNLGHTSVR
jgi:hypothetical protein